MNEITVTLTAKTWGCPALGWHKMVLLHGTHQNTYYGPRLLGFKLMFGPFVSTRR